MKLEKSNFWHFLVKFGPKNYPLGPKCDKDELVTETVLSVRLKFAKNSMNSVNLLLFLKNIQKFFSRGQMNTSLGFFSHE